MNYTTINGVVYRVLPITTTRGQLKTSSVWNTSKTKVRPCKNTKVLLSYTTRKKMLGNVPYGKEVVPRYT